MTGSNGLQSATPVGGATILSRRAMSTLIPFFMVGSKGRGLDPMIQASVASWSLKSAWSYPASAR